MARGFRAWLDHCRRHECTQTGLGILTAVAERNLARKVMRAFDVWKLDVLSTKLRVLQTRYQMATLVSHIEKHLDRTKRWFWNVWVVHAKQRVAHTLFREERRLKMTRIIVKFIGKRERYVR